MTRNEHVIDRIVRIVLAFLLFAGALTITPWLAVLGVILLATGLMGWCPIYRILGISTCRVSAKN